MHACLRSHRSSLSPACKREEALLEQQEAEHIELRPGLMQACADERAAFCKGVAPGSARVFRCALAAGVLRCMRAARGAAERVSAHREAA